MSRNLNRSIALLTIVSTAFLLTACQDEPVVQVRAAVDALDRDTADARKARISNIGGELVIHATPLWETSVRTRNRGQDSIGRSK